MTQQEFTTSTKVEVTADEFEAINVVYMNSDLDKDEFCNMWQKMNASRVAEAKAQRKAQAEQERIRNYKWLLIEKLSKITRRNMEIAVRASNHLSKTAKDFLEKEGIKWDYNQWGGYITTSDIAYDLKKSMGLV